MMEYFVEQGPTHREVLDKVRTKYGENARVLSHRAIRMGGFLGFFAREGVEVTGYYSYEPVKRKSVDIEEEKKKILSAVKSDKTIDMVLKEVQAIRERMDNQPAQPAVRESHLHPTLEAIDALLERNDFTREFIDAMLGRARAEFSVDQLDDLDLVQERVVDWIGEQILIAEDLRLDVGRGRRNVPSAAVVQKAGTMASSGAVSTDEGASRTVGFAEGPQVVILVGPTGVGKTTTIAKLAAMYGIEGRRTKPRKVRILTIDNYRIGAKQQIEIYGEIMGIPVGFVETPEDLKKQLSLHQDVDLIFVDTIGKSPKDYTKLGEMRELLRGCGSRSSVHLALSATTKTGDAYEILRQFEPFNYQSVIITKLDETTRIGNILSVLAEKKKPISFVTDGQGVPQDISRASSVKLLTNLDGFRINRERLEAQYAEG